MIAEPVCPICLEDIFGYDEFPPELTCDCCGSDLTTVEVGNETVILVKQL